jgi:3-hydroxybutyryl-CoA dehydrogenase
MRHLAVVVGAGTMGAGIALLLAHKGLAVSLTGRRSSRLEHAMERIKGSLAFLASERHVEASEAEQALARIRPSLDLPQALASADLVIEAIAEDPDGKRAIFTVIGAHTPREALVASTTSGLNIFDLAPDFPAPERLLIAHFWNPPYLIPLVEVVPGPATGPAAVQEMEALDLIERGVIDAAGIDAVMRESIALRFPVLDLLAIADFGGLETFMRIWDHLFPLLSNTAEVPSAVRRAVAEGALGLNASRGFYDYRGRSKEALLRERDRRLLLWLRERELLFPNTHITCGERRWGYPGAYLQVQSSDYEGHGRLHRCFRRADLDATSGVVDHGASDHSMSLVP